MKWFLEASEAFRHLSWLIGHDETEDVVMEQYNKAIDAHDAALDHSAANPGIYSRALELLGELEDRDTLQDAGYDMGAAERAARMWETIYKEFPRG